MRLACTPPRAAACLVRDAPSPAAFLVHGVARTTDNRVDTQGGATTVARATTRALRSTVDALLGELGPDAV